VSNFTLLSERPSMSHRSLRLLRTSRAPIRNIFLSQSRPIPSRISIQSARLSSTSAAETKPPTTLLRNILYGTSFSIFVAFSYYYITDTRASVHQWLVVPLLRWLYPDAEDAHHVGTEALKTLYAFGLHPRERVSKTEEAKGVDLSVEVFGRRLSNPIGISAGLDKAADIPDALFALGPAIVEVGGVTPLPQDGNPRPRVFRLPSQQAIINRYGLNSLGAVNMAARLRERVRVFAYNYFGIERDAEDFVLNGGAGVPPGSLQDGKMLVVQVAKNKWTKDDDIQAVTKDFVTATKEVAVYSDIISVNVSSPNTPGLRTLQRVEPLTRILEGVVNAAKSVKRRDPPKVMVKVSPDEDSEEQIQGIVEAVWRSGVDGIIVGNTTKRRTNLVSADIPAKERQTLEEEGGYSGPQMFQRTLDLVKRYRNLLNQGPLPLEGASGEGAGEGEAEKNLASSAGAVSTPDEPSSNIVEKIATVKDAHDASSAGISEAPKPTRGTPEPKVIFATGGITNGKQALEVLNAGASVVQVYTGLIYGGSGTITRIKKEMRDEISRK